MKNAEVYSVLISQFDCSLFLLQFFMLYTL